MGSLNLHLRSFTDSGVTPRRYTYLFNDVRCRSTTRWKILLGQVFRAPFLREVSTQPKFRGAMYVSNKANFMHKGNLEGIYISTPATVKPYLLLSGPINGGPVICSKASVLFCYTCGVLLEAMCHIL